MAGISLDEIDVSQFSFFDIVKHLDDLLNAGDGQGVFEPQSPADPTGHGPSHPQDADVLQVLPVAGLFHPFQSGEQGAVDVGNGNGAIQMEDFPFSAGCLMEIILAGQGVR